jgi:hypothetical protein
MELRFGRKFFENHKKKNQYFVAFLQKRGFLQKKRYTIKEFFETKVKPFLSRLRGRKKNNQKYIERKKLKVFVLL